jgi:putative component of toxin-antitoxin plasmid stabilization module
LCYHQNVIEIRQYVDLLGRNPFDRWFERLDDDLQARVTISLDRLERGNTSAARGVGSGVFELRLDFGLVTGFILEGMESGWSSF